MTDINSFVFAHIFKLDIETLQHSIKKIKFVKNLPILSAHLFPSYTLPHFFFSQVLKYHAL